MCVCPGYRITRYDTPRRYSEYSPNRNIRRGLYLAFCKSFSSRVHTGKHCAVLFDKHLNIVKTFVNCHKPDGGMGTIHAEEGLIETILNEDPYYDFSNCTLLVVKTNKIGGFSNSAPCDKCLGLIRRYNIGMVVFTNHTKLMTIKL